MQLLKLTVVGLLTAMSMQDIGGASVSKLNVLIPRLSDCTQAYRFTVQPEVQGRPHANAITTTGCSILGSRV